MSMRSCVFFVFSLFLIVGVSSARIWYVDDDGPGDPFPGDPNVSDPLEDGSELHPFDAIQEAVDAAAEMDTILIRDGLYLDEGNYNIRIDKPVHLKGEGGPENCVIDCQHSGSGITMTVPAAQPVVIEGLRVLHAAAGFSSSGILIRGEVTVRNCQIQENQVTGIVCIGNNTILDCVIENNNFTLGNGGGIYCYTDRRVRIEDCIVHNNETSGWGGGICCGYGGHAEIKGCSIQHNKATSDGGGLYGFDESYLSISDCDIRDNTAYLGGGINLRAGKIDRCRVQGNYASVSGGGIWARGYITLQNCLFTDNQANNGGAIMAHTYNNAFAEIRHCTIVNNHAVSRGGGLWGGCRIANSVVWGNRADLGAQLAVNDLIIVSHSVIEDNPLYYFPDESNLILRDTFSTDPNFVDGENGDYHLNPESPCIDAVDHESAGGVCLTDLDGQVRILDGDGNGTAAADMGCCEYVPSGESVIQAEPSRLYFTCLTGSPLQQEQTLRIFNSGQGVVNWTIEEACDWLEVSAYFGTADPNSFVSVSIDAAGLEPGIYTGSLALTDPAALNSPYPVTVLLYVVPETAFWVPFHYPTIQSAVDAAGANDTILVADGTYHESLTINKPILLKGATGPDYCILAGTGRMNMKGITGGEYKLEGLTVTGFEQGLYNTSTHTEIRNCIIRNNFNTSRYGGGIFSPATALFENCDILANVGGTGGGIFAFDGAQIDNCRIRDNVALGVSLDKLGGGGAYLEGDCSLQDCIIESNFSRTTGGGITIAASANGLIESSLINDNSCGKDGGGIFIQNSITSLRNLSVLDNTAERDGGGIYSYMGQVNLDYGIIKGNTAGSSESEWGDGNGGGICLYRGMSELGHCEITNNASLFSGGGICLLGGDLTLSNSTIQGNTTIGWGGGIESYGLSYFPHPDPRYHFVYPATLNVRNCNILWNHVLPNLPVYGSGGIHLNGTNGNLINSILWGNESGVYDSYLSLYQQIFAPGPSHSYPDEPMFSVKYCNIQDWPSLESYYGLIFEECMNIDPNFATGGTWDGQGTAEPEDDVWIEGDYHLRSQAGRWDASIGQWVTDAVSSPCIDAGDPNDLNWHNELWPHGGRINMGAYGGTAEASMSPNPVGNVADLNHDGAVDLADWGLWADDWMFEKVLMDADMDRDGDVDLDDLVIFIGQWTVFD